MGVRPHADQELPGEAAAQVYDRLRELGIAYLRFDHPPVATADEAAQYWTDVPAVHCKNLFLRNQRGNRHFLVIVPLSKRVDLRRLSGRLATDRLSFASAERLMRHLGVTPGSVSPFGLIHDAAHAVQVVLDEDLGHAERVTFHPNDNTATLSITRADFERFLASTGHHLRYVRVEA